MLEIKLRNVTKNFGVVQALGGVNLTLKGGEILALVGENGAGKSTLMKILSGVIPSGDFEGEILIDGRRVQFRSPAEAEAHGIAIIHQELSAFPHLSVAENLFVGHWPKRSGFIDLNQMEREARSRLVRVGAHDIDPKTLMSNLSTGSQQLVEIAKALGRNSRVLILDEPTSSLTPQEAGKLFQVLRALRLEGRALVYISHKMEEIFELADQVAVLRDGHSVHQGLASESNASKLISLMVGRPLDRLFPEKPDSLRKNEEPLFSVRDFKAFESERRTLGPLSFDLHKGEILGFAGLLGAGRTEIFRAMLGREPTGIRISGHAMRCNLEIKAQTPRESLTSGVAIVGEDRKRDSILPTRSLDENVSLARLALGGATHILRPQSERRESTSSLESLKTRCRDIEQQISDLSGGNQQKVVIGRVLQAAPEVLVLDEPTRGVDVGAKFDIYQILFTLASQGRGLIVISSDLPELMALCDRIAVMADGQLTAIIPRQSFSQESIMTAALARNSRHSPTQETQLI